MHDAVENLKAKVRCPECRTHFRERIHRIILGERVSCPFCRNDLRFHCIDHIRPGEDAAAYVRRVERETDHPHFVRESD